MNYSDKVRTGLVRQRVSLKALERVGDRVVYLSLPQKLREMIILTAKEHLPEYEVKFYGDFMPYSKDEHDLRLVKWDNDNSPHALMQSKDYMQDYYCNAT